MKNIIIEEYNHITIGRFYVAHSSKGIFKIGIGTTKQAFLKLIPENKKIILKTKKRGKEIPQNKLDLSNGTEFQKKIWLQIKKIPKGETRSYAWLAKQIHHPKAIRAAAHACGANPVPLLIPCHRVICSDGTIGGFSGPLKLKKFLLKLEGVNF